LGITREELEPVKTAESGNIFNFGSQKTDEMGLYYTDAEGKQQSLYIGSYGIGITRAMGVIAEKMSDEKGLVWPKSIAPYHVYLVSIGDVDEEATKLYGELKAAGITVLSDDRDERPGAKFSDAELIGLPYRVTISRRLLDEGKLELTYRATGETEVLTPSEVLAKIAEM